MNREIKFRIVINGELKYLPHQNYSLVFGDDQPKVLQFHRGAIIAEHLNPTIMQFTGLKDKNGKDIYEGDIILFEGLNCYEAEEVKFEDGAFYPFNNDYLYSECEANCKITGNSHENPELLDENRHIYG